MNPNKNRLLFFSEDSQRVFCSESDQQLNHASVAHYEVRTGQFLERVELWHYRIFKTGMIPAVMLDRMPSHNHRTLVAILSQSDGSKGDEFYDAYEGQNPIAKLTDINQVYYSLSNSRRWVHYFPFDQKKLERPDLIVADANTGEKVLHFKPEYDAAGKVALVYGWLVCFDPTERFVAVDWNALQGLSPGYMPDLPQSQIRIYDLQTHQEVRRLNLPPRSHWSVRNWEGNQLWVARTWAEYSNGALKSNPINYYSLANRMDLTQDDPKPVEYPHHKDSNGTTCHTRGPEWLAFLDTGIGKKGEMPQILRKLTEWFPSMKKTIEENYPEHGNTLWFADGKTGQRLWECRRVFNGPHAISPDGQWLAITLRKQDAIEIEMWETNTPRRWLEVLGFLCMLGIWIGWRRIPKLGRCNVTALDSQQAC